MRLSNLTVKGRTTTLEIMMKLVSSTEAEMTTITVKKLITLSAVLKKATIIPIATASATLIVNEVGIETLTKTTICALTRGMKSSRLFNASKENLQQQGFCCLLRDLPKVRVYLSVGLSCLHHPRWDDYESARRTKQLQ